MIKSTLLLVLLIGSISHIQGFGTDYYHESPHRLLQENYAEAGTNWTGTCSTGTNQSPIPLATASATCDADSQLLVTFNDTTISTTLYDPGATMRMNGTWSSLQFIDDWGNSYEFEASQLHFHAPSEHTINGEQFDLEMHILHTL